MVESRGGRFLARTVTHEKLEGSVARARAPS
jgi:uncharacterized protein (DUF1330 family)